jgi:hypothetical protein
MAGYMYRDLPKSQRLSAETILQLIRSVYYTATVQLLLTKLHYGRNMYPFPASSSSLRSTPLYRSERPNVHSCECQTND